MPPKNLLLGFLLVLIAARFLVAALLPPIQDEAYYFYWSRFLDWGYFDHPPFVAWLSAFQSLAPAHPLAARLGTLLLGLLSIPLLWNLAKRSGLDHDESLVSVVILTCGSLAGFLLGFLTTPDIPLLFCWIAALHEAAAALDGRPKRWLSAGLMTGLGILGKYTMTLIGPVFLVALLVKRKGLKGPWPYAGGLLCVLVLLPHILWLAQNDWITTRFQFGRGLKSEYGVSMRLGTDLPQAERALDGSDAMRLAQYFSLPTDELPKPRPPVGIWQKRLQNFGDFVGSQFALWGLLLGPILYALFKARRRRAAWRSMPHQALIVAATVVPLLVFGLLSPFQHIEANWPAMYCIGAAILLAQYCTLSRKYLLATAFANILACCLVAWHAHTPLLAKKPHKDRILKETSGYKPMAAHLAKLSDLVFADTYQNVSEIAFYQPQLKVQQWPGIARRSELQRRPEMNPVSWQELQTKAGFYLLTDNLVPPFIPGTEITQLTELMDCPNGKFGSTTADYSIPYERFCPKPIHRWSLVRYRLTSSPQHEL